MALAPTTILDLPDDLLAHVLRFATGAARRDGQRPPAVPLSDWRYAAVSTTFRRAFLKNVSALALDTPSAYRLADLNWRPIEPCTSLRRLSVGVESGLGDAHLIRLFDSLKARGLHIRQAELTLDRNVTHATVLALTSKFGKHVTHLALRVPYYRRVRRRRLQEPHAVYHGAPGALHGAADGAAAHGAHGAAPQIQGQFLGDDDADIPPPFLPDPHLPPQPNAEPVIHVFDGVPALNAQQAFANLNQMMAEQPGAQQPDPNAVIAQVHPVQQMMDDDDDDDAQQEAEMVAEMAQEQNQMMDVVDNALPNIFHALDAPPADDMVNLLDALEPNDQDAANAMMAVPFVNENPNPNPMPHHFPAHDAAAARLNSCVPLSDDVLTMALSRMPMLRELYIDRGRHIMNAGIIPLAKCRHLESLVLTGCHGVNNTALKSVLPSMTKLRLLRLGDMPHVGNPTVSALCTGPARVTLQILELTKIGKVTDPAVRQLVNACENLETVHIADCPKIACEAASHLSCSLRLRDIFFKPHVEFPLTNRTSIHFSCASSTLRSLQLVGCKNLSLDGIVALGNLPGLRKLHLRGLRHVSQDVMRQLGVFPKLDDLVLDGPMFLTDLGVKVLCGQRGHRFLHLALLDSTKNLTDEALDCVMTWCVSLRSLEIHGYFKAGAIDRLHECIPNASLTVMSSINGRQDMPGHGGVWDPFIPPV